MKTTRLLPARAWGLLLLMLLLAALACGANAQEGSLWGGYAVIAEDTDGALHTAVVRDAATGGRTLLIGETRDGVFSEIGRGEHAVPAEWSDTDLIVEAHAAQSAEDETWVIARVDGAQDWQVFYVRFVPQGSGWQLRGLRSKRGDAEYSLTPADSGWRAGVSTGTQWVSADLSGFPAELESFDAEQAMDAAGAAAADKLRREEEVFLSQRRETLASTPWINALPLVRRNYYVNDKIATTVAVLQTDTKTALCVFSRDASGAWAAAVNDNFFPGDIGADAIDVSFPYTDDPAFNATEFTVQNWVEAASPVVTFRRDAAGEWTVWETGFTAEDGEHWFARYPDGLLKLYPGHYVGEEGFLYRRADSGMTAFSTFDPALMKAAMLKLYADFMAGEPPMIPEGKSACALPQPCGAALKEGTYAVYTGPGAQYYREANGEAAVSAEDWVQVFGTDGDWVLIQYRVGGPLLRFGYIQTSALQSPDAVPALALEAVPLQDTGNEFVTSNPLGKGGRIQLTPGAAMTRLGMLGDFWIYVELTLPNGRPARMFAEVEPSHG